LNRTKHPQQRFFKSSDKPNRVQISVKGALPRDTTFFSGGITYVIEESVAESASLSFVTVWFGYTAPFVVVIPPIDQYLVKEKPLSKNRFKDKSWAKVCTF
jgi:hypothetical protein